MAYRIEELNAAALNDPAKFVADGDADYSARIINAAEEIYRNMEISPIVLLSGPSGAGKTTTAKRIEDELEKRGINSHTISMDNYFLTLDPDTCPRTADGDIDFESPLLMDMDLLNEHFDALAGGKEICIPYYDFQHQRRSPTQFTRMQLKDNEIAIFEGIHALNDMITDENPKAFGLYISVANEIVFPYGEIFKHEWTRLIRRIVRDDRFRGANAEYTLSLWENVMAGEAANITPFIGKANLVFDSSLSYELSVLSQFALPQLKALPDEKKTLCDVDKIIPLLEKFVPVDPELVPANSLLREFFGGGIYSY